MTSLAAGIVDPTKAGKYRVILSDALLGNERKEIYTGIRCKPSLTTITHNHNNNNCWLHAAATLDNHKSSLFSTAPSQANLKPTTTNSTESTEYNLSFQDDSGRYVYQGNRIQGDNQYVLIFDREREVFILHRVDSMFNMNVVRTPTNNDAESLRDQYPQLLAHRPSGTNRSTSKPTPGKSTKPRKPAPKASKPPAVKKADPPKPTQSPKYKEPKPRRHASYEEDSSEDDDVLTIEDPGAAIPTTNRDFSPGFDKPRGFSEFKQQQNDDEEEEEEEDKDNMGVELEALNDADADGEDEEEEEEEEDDDDDESEHFKLPSPLTRQVTGKSVNGGNRNMKSGAAAESAPVPIPAPKEVVSDEDEDMEDVGGGASVVSQDQIDLEAELEAELASGMLGHQLDAELNAAHEKGYESAGSESVISEED